MVVAVSVPPYHQHTDKLVETNFYVIVFGFVERLKILRPVFFPLRVVFVVFSHSGVYLRFV